MAFSSNPSLHLQPPASGSGRRLRLAGGPRAPERARAWLGNVTGWLPGEAVRTLELLVSELVNNAVRHGGAGGEHLIELELRAIEGGVGVVVSDPGPGFAPSSRTSPIEDPGGWGLVLVDRMAARWGVVHDTRTRVWFELAAA
jgi:anti-sigma regulatory factor (Ser/Thr protein kinase)